MGLVVTASGNEITDATRALGIDGDGRAAETSYGCYPASQNLHPNGGFETNTDLWAASGTGASIARVGTSPKFGSWHCDVTTGATANTGIVSTDFATLISNRWTAVSPWINAPGGEPFTLSATVAGSPAGSVTWTPAAGWSRKTLKFAAPIGGGSCSISLVKTSGNVVPFSIDGVQVEQNPSDIDVAGLTGAIVTPYCHTDRSAEPWPGQPNLFPNGDFETNITGWTAFGAGATPSQSTDQAHSGTHALKCVTTTAAGIGVRAENAFALSASKLYAASIWVYAPAGEAFKIEIKDGTSTRLAINFGWTPGTGWQRLILTFTSLASPTTFSVYISKNSANAITFYTDLVVVTVQPGSTAPYIPSGARGYSSVTVPAKGILNARQMWFAIRSRFAAGTLDHGGGSFRFWRWRDDDEHRIEAFYAESTDQWGVRRAGVGDAFASCNILASSIPAVAGNIYTIIGAYEPTQIKISVNGSAFGAYSPLSTKANTNNPVITSATFEITDSGAPENSPSAGQDVLWFATGFGLLTDADAALIAGLSNDLRRGDLPGHAKTRFVWTAADSTALLYGQSAAYLGNGGLS